MWQPGISEFIRARTDQTIRDLLSATLPQSDSVRVARLIGIGKDPWGNTRVAVSATTKINRKDFGLTWNAALETGGILVGDEVTITLDVQFVKA